MSFCAGVLAIRENNQNALAEPMKPNDLSTFAQNLPFPRPMTDRKTGLERTFYAAPDQ
jgi:hypothetical protein